LFELDNELISSRNRMGIELRNNVLCLTIINYLYIMFLNCEVIYVTMSKI